MARGPRVCAVALATLLVVTPLVGCAPEPGAETPGVTPELTDKPQPDGNSWPEKAPDEAFDKHQEVPADFPETFVIPDGAVIDNVGSGANGTWFLVLRAESLDAGESLWNTVVEASGFTVTDGPEPSEGGRTAELESPTLGVSATMFPPEGEDYVLLSYDIATLAP